jgi:TatD DNase family protein
MALWADSHNHLHDPRLRGVRPLVPVLAESGVTRCVVNATSEADWQAVEDLAATHPDFVSPAFGIHPWHAHTATAGWTERLDAVLRRHPVASIGECGLDGWIKEPSMEVQAAVFREHLRLAARLDRPVTIHCLKAWDPLFEVFRESKPPERFLMHSFGGSLEIARRLERLGAWFSISGYFLQPKKVKSLQVFRALPKERLLLESDAPDMLPPDEAVSHPLPHGVNHPANLASIGARVAAELGMAADEFADLTHRNHARFFTR